MNKKCKKEIFYQKAKENFLKIKFHNIRSRLVHKFNCYHCNQIWLVSGEADVIDEAVRRYGVTRDRSNSSKRLPQNKK